MTYESGEAREALRKGHAEWQRRAEAAEADARDARFEILAHKVALEQSEAEAQKWKEACAKHDELRNEDQSVIAGLSNEVDRLRAALDLVRRGYPSPQSIASDALFSQGERCSHHRSFNGCERPEGHEGKHRAGALEWQ